MQRTSPARLLAAIPPRLQLRPAGAAPRPLRPHRPPAVPPLLQRWYQHTSKHAPNSGHSNETRDQATNRSGIAYTRHELLADWHSYARKISPLDVQWKGKDQIEAQCEWKRFFSLQHSEIIDTDRGLLTRIKKKK